MAKMKRLGPFIVMILIVIAIMVYVKPVETADRQTFGDNSREGFSRAGETTGWCDYTANGINYAFCGWTKYSYEGTNPYAKLAFTNSYNSAEGLYSYSFCDSVDCYNGRYYYPFTVRYYSEGDRLYYKITNKDNDWIKCDENGCNADALVMKGDFTVSKTSLLDKADSLGRVFVYFTAWDYDEYLEENVILENDFGPDYETGEDWLYTSWVTHSGKITIYTKDVGDCVKDDNCGLQGIVCQLGSCTLPECTIDAHCENNEICDDQKCIVVECKSNNDCNNGFCENNACVKDTDGDEVADRDDNCPEVSNYQQLDLDKDGLGDACDPVNDVDADKDYVLNEDDNCPLVYNPEQNDYDKDGLGDVCDPIYDNSDRDLDGVGNFLDNCPNTYNPYQFDWDDDGLGDECDYYNNREIDIVVEDQSGTSIVFDETINKPAEIIYSSDVIDTSFTGSEPKGTNYYLYFIIIAIGSIILYEVFRKKKK